MTLNAMQTLLLSTTDGIQAPNWQKPLVAEIAVPIPDVVMLPQPRLFIWGAVATDNGNAGRISIPRAQPGIDPMMTPPGQNVNSGYRQRLYTISCWLYGVQNNNDPNRTTKFPVLVQQVTNALMMASMPAIITDSVTGEQSQALDLGEEYSWEYDVDRTLADQRLVRNLCRIDVSVREIYQF